MHDAYIDKILVLPFMFTLRALPEVRTNQFRFQDEAVNILTG